MRIRAGIVVTGTEVLSGKVRDANGPWLADRLFELGIDLAHVTICGDRPEDMEAQLRFLADQDMQLIVTSGGLGPTADDLTGEVVAGFQGRPLELDDAMEARIAEILEPLMKRFQHLDKDAVLAANRKQAMVPEGATAIDPAGTAPGLVVPPRDGDGGPTIVVMPGPPRELDSMWPLAGAPQALPAAGPGSSAYVAGSVVSYSNEAKAELLGVDPALIERHGAVSPEVAEAMADGALERFHADIAVSITGVAGPGGGSEEKPVGYVCWCVKERSGATLARDVRLPGDRTEIRDRSTTVAMHLLARQLRGEEAPL